MQRHLTTKQIFWKLNEQFYSQNKWSSDCGSRYRDFIAWFFKRVGIPEIVKDSSVRQEASKNTLQIFQTWKQGPSSRRERIHGTKTRMRFLNNSVYHWFLFGIVVRRKPGWATIGLNEKLHQNFSFHTRSITQISPFFSTFSISRERFQLQRLSSWIRKLAEYATEKGNCFKYSLGLKIKTSHLQK